LSDTIDTRDEKGKDPSKLAFVREWLEAIDLAGDEEKDWRDDAEKAVKLFRGTERTGGRQFNILHANTETLIPALYNSIPVPDVRRRWNDGRALANPQNPQEKQQAEASSKVAKDVADTISTTSTVSCSRVCATWLSPAVAWRASGCVRTRRRTVAT
jgi:hypothetical protein